MSVPHLDTRIIDGQKTLLFGPFAGFSTKFLKQGSYFDLPLLGQAGQPGADAQSGVHNLSLVKYLVGRCCSPPSAGSGRCGEYYPDGEGGGLGARVAGQRVQVIHKDPKTGTYLQFGTEVVTGGRHAVGAARRVAGRVHVGGDRARAARAASRSGWRRRPGRRKLREMIPSFGVSLPAIPRSAGASGEETERGARAGS